MPGRLKNIFMIQWISFFSTKRQALVYGLLVKNTLLVKNQLFESWLKIICGLQIRDQNPLIYTKMWLISLISFDGKE